MEYFTTDNASTNGLSRPTRNHQDQHSHHSYSDQIKHMASTFQQQQQLIEQISKQNNDLIATIQQSRQRPPRPQQRPP